LGRSDRRDLGLDESCLGSHSEYYISTKYSREQKERKNGHHFGKKILQNFFCENKQFVLLMLLINLQFWRGKFQGSPGYYPGNPALIGWVQRQYDLKKVKPGNHTPPLPRSSQRYF